MGVSGVSCVLNELLVYWERQTRIQETKRPPRGATLETAAWVRGVQSTLSSASELGQENEQGSGRLRAEAEAGLLREGSA